MIYITVTYRLMSFLSLRPLSLISSYLASVRMCRRDLSSSCISCRFFFWLSIARSRPSSSSLRSWMMVERERGGEREVGERRRERKRERDKQYPPISKAVLFFRSRSMLKLFNNIFHMKKIQLEKIESKLPTVYNHIPKWRPSLFWLSKKKKSSQASKIKQALTFYVPIKHLM